MYLVIAALPGPVAHEAQQMPGVEDVEDDEEAAPGVPTARVFSQFRNAYTINRYYSLPSPTSQHTYIRSTDKYLEATFSFLLVHNAHRAMMRSLVICTIGALCALLAFCRGPMCTGIS